MRRFPIEPSEIFCYKQSYILYVIFRYIRNSKKNYEYLLSEYLFLSITIVKSILSLHIVVSIYVYTNDILGDGPVDNNLGQDCLAGPKPLHTANPLIAQLLSVSPNCAW